MSSPIETVLRDALLRAAPAQYILVDGTDHASTIPAKCGDFDNWQKYVEPMIWLDEDAEHRRGIYLYAAVSVLTYRADFLLELGVRKLAIECDGHEFHDRTKQQAAYDRARDRELLRIGIPTIRFTGSEIIHSPERCAEESYQCLLALPDSRALFHAGWEEAIGAWEAQAERIARESPSGIEEHW
jgi:very-short-patch-repair endonuclease